MSEEMLAEPSSPGWKRPPEVIRIKRRKRKIQPNNKLDVPDGILRTRNVCNTSEEARMRAKRRNPFCCGSLPKRANLGDSAAVSGSLPKRANLGDSAAVSGSLPKKVNLGDSAAVSGSLPKKVNLGDSAAVSGSLPKKVNLGDSAAVSGSLPKKVNLGDSAAVFATRDEDSIAGSDVEGNLLAGLLQLGEDKEEKMSEESRSRGCCSLPEDLSLKLRVRFTSRHPFSWCGRVRTTDEAAAVCGFVRCQEKQTLADAESWASSFQQSAMTWIHPNLPWLRLFPRMVSSQNVDSKGPPLTVNPNIQEALLSDWTNSLRSVFQLLKAEICPYFYVCGHQFTVLFHGAAIGGAKANSALLTPTSRGLREALDNEGVSFKMPLAARQSLGSKPCRTLSGDGRKEEGNDPGKSSEWRGDESDDDDITIDYSGASCWLESMGLDKSSFPELDPRRVQVQRTKMKSVDHFPESLVQVEGGDTQALFNFLINSRSLVTQSGALAGVPPTILAPVAFEGATLRALKVKHGSIRQTVAGKLTQVNSLEVNGPLMPLHVQQLCSLFKHSQQGNFRATFSTHPATAPFNCLHRAAAETQTTKEQDSSMTETRATKEQDGSATDFYTEEIKELVCEKGFYKWTS